MEVNDLDSEDDSDRGQQAPEAAERQPRGDRGSRDERFEEVQLRGQNELPMGAEHGDQEALVALHQRQAGHGHKTPGPFGRQGVVLQERDTEPGPDAEAQGVDEACQRIGRVSDVGHPPGLVLAAGGAEDRDLLHGSQADPQTGAIRLVEEEP